MTETAAENLIQVKPLRESDLYTMNLEQNFLGFLRPDMTTLMQIEEVITTDYPRTEDEGEKTRIFVLYTNLNGNVMPIKMLDDQRLDRPFAIDNFVNGYFSAVHEGAEVPSLLPLLAPSLVNALNESVCNALELGEEDVHERVKTVSLVTAQSLISVLLNDPLDAVLIIKAEPPKDEASQGGNVLLGAWTVKERN